MKLSAISKAGFLLVVLLLVSVDARAERGISSRVGRVIGLRGGSSLVNLDNVKDISPNVVQIGNQLFERSKNSAFVFRPLFIDGFAGRLLGATSADTIKQVRDFFLQNFDQFRGRALQLVERFLANNGALNAILGRACFSLGTTNLPDKGYEHMQGNELRVKTAALSFLLNSMSTDRNVITVSPGEVDKNGVVCKNVRGRIPAAALAVLQNDNPYDCTGRGAGPIDLGNAINKFASPDLYYQMTSAPRTGKELSDVLGTEFDKRRTFGNKIVVAGKTTGNNGNSESIVGKHPQRLLEVQNTRNIPGGSLYTSYDNPYNLPPGVKAEGADHFRNGINTDHVASELIWLAPNGFQRFYLQDKNGVRANSAPVEIAEMTQNSKVHPQRCDAKGTCTFDGVVGRDVSAGMVCMVCHSDGPMDHKVSIATGKPYTDNFGKIPAAHQQSYTTVPVYASRVDRDRVIFKNALVRAGAFIPLSKDKPNNAAPLLPDFTGAYRRNLTVAEAAQALGTSESALAGRVRLGSDGRISRTDFEAAFCGLKRTVAAATPSTGGFTPPAGSAAAAQAIRNASARSAELRGADSRASEHQDRVTSETRPPAGL